MLTKQELIDLEKKYFSVMDQGRLDETPECMAQDCVWNIYPAGTVLRADETRKYARHSKPPWRAIPPCGTATSNGLLMKLHSELQPSSMSVSVDKNGNKTELSNAKLFRVEDGKFKRLDLYFSTTDVIVSET